MKLGLLCWICVSCLLVTIDATYDGEYRSLKDYPFLAQIYRTSGLSVALCSATILSENWIVSAAHCFSYLEGAKNYVRVGSSLTLKSGKLIDVEKVLIYGDCDPNYDDHDIALIKLKNPMELNEHQQPIHIAKAHPKAGENITFLGFGAHHHGVPGKSLRSAETSIVKDETCSESYRDIYTLTKNMFCTSAKYTDIGHGDSGGSVIHDNKLIGVISQHAYKRPSIIVKVANYYDWIVKETGIKYLD